MRRPIRPLAGLLLLAGAGLAVAQTAGAPSHGGHASGIPAAMPGFSAKVILETPLLGTEARIFRLYTIELGPDGATPRHMHPGDEIALVTEGAVTLEMEGEPPRTYQSGQTFHPRPMTPHVARNASAAQPARLTVTSITEAGKPSTIVLPGPS